MKMAFDKNSSRHGFALRSETERDGEHRENERDREEGVDKAEEEGRGRPPPGARITIAWSTRTRRR